MLVGRRGSSASALSSAVTGPATTAAASVVGGGAVPGSGVSRIPARASSTWQMKKSYRKMPTTAPISGPTIGIHQYWVVWPPDCP
jgi:hypothetical protein